MNDFVSVAPPADGLQRAFADARGRRLRKASLSTGTAAAALSVVALLAGSQGTQSLVQQPAPQQPAVSQLVPDDAHQVSPRLNQGGTVQSFGTTQHRSTGAGQGQTARTEQGSLAVPFRDQHSAARAVGRPYAAGPLTFQDSYNIPYDTSCAMPGTSRLCTYASVTGTAAGTYQFYSEVCNYQPALALLHFPGRNEVDMAITQKGHEVWRWSRWHRDDGESHTIGLEGDHCATWTFEWTGVDAQGRKLPKGDYTLSVTFLANELAQQRVATAAVTIS